MFIFILYKWTEGGCKQLKISNRDFLEENHIYKKQIGMTNSKQKSNIDFTMAIPWDSVCTQVIQNYVSHVTVGLIAMASAAASFFLEAFATTDWMMYLGKSAKQQKNFNKR